MLSPATLKWGALGTYNTLGQIDEALVGLKQSWETFDKKWSGLTSGDKFQGSDEEYQDYITEFNTLKASGAQINQAITKIGEVKEADLGSYKEYDKDTGVFIGYNLNQYILDHQWRGGNELSNAIQKLRAFGFEDEVINPTILISSMAYNNNQAKADTITVVPREVWEGLGTSGKEKILGTPAIIQASAADYENMGQSLKDKTVMDPNTLSWGDPSRWGNELGEAMQSIDTFVKDAGVGAPSFLAKPLGFGAGALTAAAMGVLYTGVLAGQLAQGTFMGPGFAPTLVKVGKEAGVGMYQFGAESLGKAMTGDAFAAGQFATIVFPAVKAVPGIAKGVYVRFAPGHFPAETLGYDVTSARIDLPAGMTLETGVRLVAAVEHLSLKGEVRISVAELTDMRLPGVANLVITKGPNGVADIVLEGPSGKVIGYMSGIQRVQPTTLYHFTPDVNGLMKQARETAWNEVYNKLSTSDKVLLDGVGKDAFIKEGYKQLRKIAKTNNNMERLIDELHRSEVFEVKGQMLYTSPQAAFDFGLRSGQIQEMLINGEKPSPGAIAIKIGKGEVQTIPEEFRGEITEGTGGAKQIRARVNQAAATGKITPGIYEGPKAYGTTVMQFEPTMKGLGRALKEVPGYHLESEAIATPGYKFSVADPTFGIGGPEPKGWVVSPVGADLRFGRATGFIRDPQGRIMLVRMKGSRRYDLPGGGLKRGESLLNAVIRELKEEGGTRVRNLRHVDTLDSVFQKGDNLQRFEVFEGTVSNTSKFKPSAEIEEIVWWDGVSKLKYSVADFTREVVDRTKSGARTPGTGQPLEFKFPMGKQMPVYYMASEAARLEGSARPPNLFEQYLAKAYGDVGQARMKMPWHWKAKRTMLEEGESGLYSRMYTIESTKLTKGSVPGAEYLEAELPGGRSGLSFNPKSERGTTTGPEFIGVGDTHQSITYLFEDINKGRAPGSEILTGNPATPSSWKIVQRDIDILNLGDLTDRGGGIRVFNKTVNLLSKASREARNLNSRWHSVLGNHDLAYLTGDRIVGTKYKPRNVSIVQKGLTRLVDEGILTAAEVRNGKVVTHAGINFNKFPEWGNKTADFVANDINTRFRNAVRTGDYSDPIFDIGSVERTKGMTGNRFSDEGGGVFWARLSEGDFNSGMFKQIIGHNPHRTVGERTPGVIETDIARSRGGRGVYRESPEPKGKAETTETIEEFADRVSKLDEAKIKLPEDEWVGKESRDTIGYRPEPSYATVAKLSSLSGLGSEPVVKESVADTSSLREPSLAEPKLPLEPSEESTISEKVPEPVSESITEPTPSEGKTEPVSESIVEPTPSEKTPEPVVEPTPEPITEPTPEPTYEPISEPISEPIQEPISEPVNEPVNEPINEPVMEPVSEPGTEPVAQYTPEPIPFVIMSKKEEREVKPEEYPDAVAMRQGLIWLVTLPPYDKWYTSDAPPPGVYKADEGLPGETLTGVEGRKLPEVTFTLPWGMYDITYSNGVIQHSYNEKYYKGKGKKRKEKEQIIGNLNFQEMEDRQIQPIPVPRVVGLS